MKKYIAHVRMVSCLTYEFDAEDENEAYEIYENTDGGLFVEDESSWELEKLEEVE